MTSKLYCFHVGWLLLLATVAFGQQSEVGLTVYNNNLALVREVRTLTLEKGVREINFQDVAAQIDPTSVYFKSLTAPQDVTILEQNYEYDLVNSTRILQKYLDQEIRLEAKEGASYSGTLLSSAGNDVILRESDGTVRIVNRNTVENMSFPKLPAGLITRPTLVWKIDCRKSGEHKTEVGYLTNGIQWHAEYVGIVDKEDAQIDLGGWVSLDNKSGTSYENAKLKLVAGDVHRARKERPYGVQLEVARAQQAPDTFEEKAFFEYHLYTLQRPATVADNQVKQLSLFPSTPVKVRKKFVYDGARHGKKVNVNLEFENRKQAGLGMPLPKGKLRVYKQDEDASLVFIGEDFIDHTPKNEKVRVYVGDAFDVVGERTQQDRRTIGKSSWEENWQIELRNHKEETVEIVVVEHLGKDWEIIRNSLEYRKKDAQTIEFVVTVAANAKLTIDYVVRYNR